MFYLFRNYRNEQITTECDHVFCKECIELYLKNNNTCPNCRNEIKNYIIIILILFNSFLKFVKIKINFL